MAGRKPKPTAVKKLEGNPDKRKLNKNEPVPTKGMPECPDWLLPEAKAECKRYPLRYYEVKSLARSCNSFRMMRQRGVIDLVKFEDFVRSQFYEEGENY